MIKRPDRMVTHVGETINWTLRGFHNPTGNTVANFTLVDTPGRGLNFRTGSLPAFTNGAGITYEIRYTVAGSNQWNVLISGVDASRPFTFSLPQPGNRQYTAIGFFFGTVPAGFALGNEITLTFVVGNNAPNNMLVNNFWISYDNIRRDGESPDIPIVIIPPNNDDYLDLGDGNVPMGPMPQTGLMNHALWLTSALFLASSAGLGTMSYMKSKKRKRKGVTP